MAETLLEIGGRVIKAEVEPVRLNDLPDWRKKRGLTLVGLLRDWPPMIEYREEQVTHGG